MIRILALGGMLCMALVPETRAQSLYDEASEDWRSRDYERAFHKLVRVRAEPFGRRPAVDFMLGTSACRIETRRRWGYNVLDWMLYAYALTRDSRTKVAGERNICRQAILASAAPDVDTPIEGIVEERAAGMTGTGKTFYWASRKTQPVASYPIRRLRDMPRSLFEKRLIPIGDETAARDMVRSFERQRLIKRNRVHIHGNFLLVSTVPARDQDLASIGRTLSRYLRFLQTAYDIAPPPHYIAVYLVPSHHAVHKLAADIHGLDVSRATVGYTFVDDLSVVGAVPRNAPGTILHELFHLLVRQQFGDIPQWLDEGTASLYEVSGRNGDHYFGLPNWRGRVLSQLWRDRPSVAELIRTEWFLFDDPAQAERLSDTRAHMEEFFDEQEGRRQAAMMAMARYFLLYLQERDELPRLFRAMRTQSFDDTRRDARDHAVRVVETTLGRSAAALDQEFTAWFQNQSNQNRRGGLQPVTTGGTAHAATANVNVRTGAGTGFERLTSLRKGEVVAVFGEDSGWKLIKFKNGAIGYVSGKYLDQAVGRWTPAPQR